MTETIEVHTSCGGVFRERIDNLSNWQIGDLIAQNSDHSAISSLHQALARREAARQVAHASMAEPGRAA